MTIELIPTDTQETFTIELADGNEYTISTNWNEYRNLWFIDILTADEVPLAMQIACVPEINLLRCYKHLINGSLYCLTNENTDSLKDVYFVFEEES